ncbi:MAG: hypothetical protein K9G39_08710, partial [Chlorobium sp.]|uniref:hypothetical protein n=1 Tax=Chlorobium sp. TaxID=1095 RepID=UPI0025B8D50A
MLEILMYCVYTPVSALRPPCPRSSHDDFIADYMYTEKNREARFTPGFAVFFVVSDRSGRSGGSLPFFRVFRPG